jgi:hypothetical protein
MRGKNFVLYSCKLNIRGNGFRNKVGFKELKVVGY